MTKPPPFSPPLQQLAEGTCMTDYKWNGGGGWAGRAWSPDLPTDMALVLYLFAAFLADPGWELTSKLGGEGEVARWVGHCWGCGPVAGFRLYKPVAGFRLHKPCSPAALDSATPTTSVTVQQQQQWQCH